MFIKPGVKLINRYEIKAVLGRGGYGNVYLAYDHELVGEVAIKELLPECLTNETDKTRFVNDARTMRRLNDPNIVTVYDLLEPGKYPVDTYYIIMEFMNKGSLQDLLGKQMRLPIHDAVDITIHICRALTTAHKEKIIHRDIKPDNILLHQKGAIKLSDFGIAHIPGVQLTFRGQPGTLIWRSVEQTKNAEFIDTRSDIYSLSAVLYKMLTGRDYLDFADCEERIRKSAVVENQGEEEIIRAYYYEVRQLILNQFPRAPSTYRNEIPRILDFLVLKGLDKNPENRYQSAQELEEALLKVSYVSPIALESDLQKAVYLTEEDRLDEAIRLLRQLLKKNEDNYAALELLGDIYTKRCDYKQALEKWEKVRIAASGQPRLYFKLASLYIRLHSFDTAIKIYKQGLEIWPDDAQMQYGLATAYHQSGQHEMAIETLQNSNRLKPDKRKEALINQWAIEGKNKDNLEDTLS